MASLKEVTINLETMTIDAVYKDRNLLAQTLARLAAVLGYGVGVKLDESDPDPAWPVLFIELPTGQVSYHIPADQFVGDWGPYFGRWDRHDVEEKHARLRKLIERPEWRELAEHEPEYLELLLKIGHAVGTGEKPDPEWLKRRDELEQLLDGSDLVGND